RDRSPGGLSGDFDRRPVCGYFPDRATDFTVRVLPRSRHVTVLAQPGAGPAAAPGARGQDGADGLPHPICVRNDAVLRLRARHDRGAGCRTRRWARHDLLRTAGAVGALVDGPLQPGAGRVVMALVDLF